MGAPILVTNEKKDSTSSPLRSRSSWVDPRSLAVLFACGAFLLFLYHHPLVHPDEGTIVTSADRILRGEVPFRDFFVELGPGTLYLQAAIFKLCGSSLGSIRFTTWLVGIAISWLVFQLSKAIIDGPLAIAPSLLFVAICYSYPPAYAVLHHWWGSLFFMLMILALMKHTALLKSGSIVRLRWLLFAAGILAMATFLCMQSDGAWAILLGATFLVMARKVGANMSWREAGLKGGEDCIWFFLGVGTVVGVAIGYFGAQGAFTDWVHDNIVFLLVNYLPYERKTPFAHSWASTSHFAGLLLAHGAKELPAATRYYSFSLVGPVVAFTATTLQLLMVRPARGSRPSILLLYLLGAIGAHCAESHAADTVHFIYMAPIMLVLLVQNWQFAMGRWHVMRRPLLALAATVTAASALVAYRTVSDAGRGKTPIYTRRGICYINPTYDPHLQTWIDVIEKAVPPDAETFIFPYDSYFYFYTATRNSTRYNSILSEYNSHQQIEEAYHSLETHKPAYIFSFDRVERQTPVAHFPDDPPDLFKPNPVEEMLAQPQSPYYLEADVSGMEVWALKRRAGDAAPPQVNQMTLGIP